MYNEELQFEHDFVEGLKQNGWIDGILNHPTEKDLIRNWANILFENNRQMDRLGDNPLTDTEMAQIIEKINELRTPFKINGFINGRTISIVRDNVDDTLHFGKEVSLKIYDRQEIAAGQSRYQIAKQPIFESKSSILNNRRGDIMLLINGMPLFHIELKKSNVPIRQATYQLEKYAHEGIYQGIYQLIQIFVAVTPEETLYFANPGPEGKFNSAFYFHWEDFNSELVNDWKQITKTLLSIPMAHQLIGFYTVADDTDKTLKVMRSYQYYACNKISDIVSRIDWKNPTTRGGHIWHTTGSGKTMTSFKAAQLISNTKDADKVVFLMDRIELGTQSLEDYQGYADDKDDVAGTEDTKDLITKLKDEKNTLIVTSIQKMSLIKEVVGIYSYDIDKINEKRIVIIVDECHRDTFGIMMASIKETFPKAVLFGFTGTPITKKNQKRLSITADIFGDELHRYLISDGIRDKNVLGFDLYKVPTFLDIELKKAVALEKAKAKSEEEALADETKSKIYYKFMNMDMASYKDENGNKIKGIEDYIPNSQYNTENHREQVVKNIMDHWKRLSRNNLFSALFATNSIEEAIEYYRLFKKKNAKNLFHFTVLVDPSIDNKEGATFKEDGLVEIITDYNEMFGQKFTLSKSSSFKKDVSNRLAHKKTYVRMQEKDKLGLLIVVDQLLTGFDSKWINTLYLDKVLQYENIIQAFSRTNRVFNLQEKPFGIIKYYRKPYTMEKNIEKAMDCYSGEKPFQLFVPKLEENMSKMNVVFQEIKDLFESEGIKDFAMLPKEKENRRKFVKLFNEFNKYFIAARIQGYIPKSSMDNICIKPREMEYLKEFKNIEAPISIEALEALKQRYKELEKEHIKHADEVPYDIDGNLIEMDDGKIDSDYMNKRFSKFLKILNQPNYSQKELDDALSSLHKSFASLSQEQQKYANILLHDIESGDAVIEDTKSFIDCITEYESKIHEEQIKQISKAFGLDENKLRLLIGIPVTEYDINAFGRFDELIKTVDEKKAKTSLEQLYQRQLKNYEVYLEVDELLRKFIIEGEFDINSLMNNNND